MRGHFSIEWMAQSSQAAGPDPAPAPGPGPAACGTHAESLPGFYCRAKSEKALEQREASRSPSLEAQQRATEASFSSGTEEETSGYESEGCRSLSPSAPPDRRATATTVSLLSPPSGRKPRTAFTSEQISSLERAFKRNAYLGTQDKAELCKKLNLSDKQIRNWFQNRRMKLKRTVQDALAHACQANMASQFMHYPELQSYRPGPYPRYHSAAAPEAPATGPFVRHHGVQYNSRLSAVPALPLDSYQYSGLPGVATQLMGSYSSYPQYY